MPEGAIGLRQSDALFQHTVRLHEKIEALPQGEVRAIGVSTRPARGRGLVYALLSGRRERRAQRGAFAFRAAFYRISSAGAYRGGGAVGRASSDLLDGRLPGVASVRRHERAACTSKCGADGLPDCTCIGGTTDLAAGQLLDRAGALLGCRSRRRAALDELALTAEPQKGFRSQSDGLQILALRYAEPGGK
ncbi:MAG: hypothetical protein ACLR4Z_07835 [Butyricicoccaceae bacterium]